MGTDPTGIAQVFISVSEAALDVPWAERLRDMLAPRVRAGLMVFDRLRVLPGDERKARLAAAVRGARVAVVLVSPEYLKDEALVAEELSAIVAAAAPIGKVMEVTLGGDGRATRPLGLGGLPDRVPLWVRVATSPRGDRGYRDAMFAIIDEPCGLWQSLLGLFGAGRPACDPNLKQALLPYQGDTGERPAVVLEVRRAVVGPDGVPAKVERVAGTLGATGVAWEGAGAMLVTIGPLPEAKPGEGGPGTAMAPPARPLAPGLYRVVLGGAGAKAAPVLLWRAGAGETPTAPLALGGGRVALVRERAVVGPDGVAATVAVVERGKVTSQVPLRRTVHQLLAARATSAAGAGPTVVALSRHEGTPALLAIRLERGSTPGSVVDLGYDARALHALRRQPHGVLAAIATEDMSGENGWDIALLDDRGTVRDFLVGPGHDLLPAWRPDGAELAWIGEAGEAGDHGGER